MWQTDSCRCLTCTGPCKLLATVVMVTAVSFYCELSPFCIAGHIWWKSTQLRFWFQKTSLLFSTLLLVEESHIVIHFLKQPKYHIFPGKPKVVSHTFWHLTGSRSNQQQSYGVIFFWKWHESSPTKVWHALYTVPSKLVRTGFSYLRMTLL